MRLVNLEGIYKNGYSFSCIDIGSVITYEHVFIENPTLGTLQSHFGDLNHISTINFTIELDTIKIGKIFVPYYSYDCEGAFSEKHVKLTPNIEDFEDFATCLDSHMMYALILAYCKNANLKYYYVVAGDADDLIPDYKISDDVLAGFRNYFSNNQLETRSAFTEIDGVTIALDVSAVFDHYKVKDVEESEESEESKEFDSSVSAQQDIVQQSKTFKEQEEVCR